MKTHVLTGNKNEIVQGLAGITGEVREAIVFVDDTSAALAPAPEVDDIFVEMQPFMVQIADFDDSRDSIYSPADGE
jgi:hypothetical protein